jgi:hypothetical protein
MMLVDPSQNSEDVAPGWTAEEIAKLIKLGYFDNDFYVSMNPDIASSGVNPLLHYIHLGWREGRQPSAHISFSEIDFHEHMNERSRNPLNLFDRNRQLEAQ